MTLWFLFIKPQTYLKLGWNILKKYICSHFKYLVFSMTIVKTEGKRFCKNTVTHQFKKQTIDAKLFLKNTHNGMNFILTRGLIQMGNTNK